MSKFDVVILKMIQLKRTHICISPEQNSERYFTIRCHQYTQISEKTEQANKESYISNSLKVEVLQAVNQTEKQG